MGLNTKQKIIKVLFLSSAGISDMEKYKNENGSFFKDTKCYLCCLLRLRFCIKFVVPTIQKYFNNCLFRPLIKIHIEMFIR